MNFYSATENRRDVCLSISVREFCIKKRWNKECVFAGVKKQMDVEWWCHLVATSGSCNDAGRCLGWCLLYVEMVCDHGTACIV